MKYETVLKEAQVLTEAPIITTTALTAILVKDAKAKLKQDKNMSRSKLSAAIIANAYSVLRNTFKKKLGKEEERDIIWTAVNNAKALLGFNKPQKEF